MKKDSSKIGLIVLVSILSILVIALSSYIVYDKVFDNKNNFRNDGIDDDNIIDKDEDAMLLTNEDAIVIIKELSKKYYEYDTALGPYCGEFNRDDYLSFGSYEVGDFRDYWASSTYGSINEITEYFKSFMVEKLFPTYLNDGVSYIEQNGKLYCQLSHKGPGFIYQENESSFKIDSIEQDKIISSVILVGDAVGLVESEGTIIAEKSLNGNWLVLEYNVKLKEH